MAESIYTQEPLTPYEESEVQKMVDNGTDREAAIRSRFAQRKKQKLTAIHGKSCTVFVNDPLRANAISGNK